MATKYKANKQKESLLALHIFQVIPEEADLILTE